MPTLLGASESRAMIRRELEAWRAPDQVIGGGSV